MARRAEGDKARRPEPAQEPKKVERPVLGTAKTKARSSRSR